MTPLRLVPSRRDPLADFRRARAAMLRQWEAWIATKPAPEEIGETLHETIQALRMEAKIP